MIGEDFERVMVARRATVSVSKRPVRSVGQPKNQTGKGEYPMDREQLVRWAVVAAAGLLAFYVLQLIIG
jgi:hypothetical protein